MKNKLLFAFSACLFAFTGSFAQDMKVIKTFPVGGDAGWDYIAVHNHKIYVTHGSQVNVLNENSGDSIGVIPGTIGVHGVAFCDALNRGYTSNGRANNVYVFDLGTNKILDSIATGENPDAITYEPFSKKIITCNGRGKSLSIIDPVKNEVIATIELQGKPEEAMGDGKGKLFVNLEDENEIAVVDLKTYKLITKWPLSPGESPTGLAYDKVNNRLFAGCDVKMIVMNALNGNVVADLPIGEGCDGLVFDKKLNMIFTSNGEGNVTAIKQIDADHYKVARTIQTQRSARTITLNEDTHTLYLPACDLEPKKPGDSDETRPQRVPGSFKVLVIR
ncbi:MAG: YncE family protein [Chitinophagaceae bacterium]